MEESVKVYIRVRPPNQNEVKNRNNSKCLATLDEHSIEINYPRDTMRNFSFDFVFSE